MAHSEYGYLPYLLVLSKDWKNGLYLNIVCFSSAAFETVFLYVTSAVPPTMFHVSMSLQLVLHKLTTILLGVSLRNTNMCLN